MSMCLRARAVRPLALLALAGCQALAGLAAASPLGAAARAALAAGRPVAVLVEYDSAAVDSALAAARTARGLRRDDAALRTERAQAYAALKGRVDPAIAAQGGVKLRDYRNLPIALWRISSSAALASIERLPSVLRVHENTILHPVSVSDLGFIDQPQAAAQGASGAGTTVSVIDGGLGTNYLDFSDFGTCLSGALPQAGCRVVYDKDFYTGANGPVSQETTHGTNVSAIALGVAPGSNLAMFDVFSGTGAATSDVLTAMDESIDLQSTYNIVAINLSLGDGTSNASPCTTSVFRTAVTNAMDSGITVVAAAGNSGSKSGLGSPACTPGAVSVGAVYDAAYGTIEWQATADSGAACTDVSAADLVTCFSQSASYLSVLAPGTFVNAPSSAFQESGTSQATPHVSGAIAVLRAAYPAEPLSQTVQRLQITGPVDTDPANGVTVHRLNLLAAVDQGTSLTLSGSGPTTATAGAKSTYALTATNSGPLMASDVKIVDTLPAGAEFVSASSGCTYAAGVVTCKAATLGVDANVTFSIVVEWTTTGAVYDGAVVTADQLDTAAPDQETLGFGVAPPASNGGVDGPLPLWAYAGLAALLFAVAVRRQAVS